MKKLFLVMGAAFFLSCNSNPSATGDAVIMQEEKENNALEWQKGPSDTTVQSAPVQIESSAAKDSLQKK